VIIVTPDTSSTKTTKPAAIVLQTVLHARLMEPITAITVNLDMDLLQLIPANLAPTTARCTVAQEQEQTNVMLVTPDTSTLITTLPAANALQTVLPARLMVPIIVIIAPLDMDLQKLIPANPVLRTAQCTDAKKVVRVNVIAVTLDSC
jgi:hypothetical protein